jgi:hypothetical protein
VSSDVSGLLRTRLAVHELVTADHNGNEASDLGDSSGEKSLQIGRSGVERRAALCERNTANGEGVLISV